MNCRRWRIGVPSARQTSSADLMARPCMQAYRELIISCAANRMSLVMFGDGGSCDAAKSSICAISEILSRVPWMLAISISENAFAFCTAKCALSLPSARLGGASKAAVVGAASIAVVATVGGAAARARLAATCVSLLLLLELDLLLCVF